MTFFESVQVQIPALFPSPSKCWRNSLKWHHVICLMTMLHWTEITSELRFCHKGPHKILESDCPGGFIAFEPINITCLYYVKSPDTPDLNVTLSPNLCEEGDTALTLDPSGDGNYDEVLTIHQIYYSEIINDEIALTDEPSGEPLVNTTSCVHPCFPEFIDPFIPEDLPMLLEKPNQTEEEKQLAEARYVNVTKQFFVYLVLDDENLFDDDEDIITDEKDEADRETQVIPDELGEKIDTDKGKTYIMKLLAQTMRIAMLKCAPFIEANYMTQVLRVMTYFYDTNEDFDLVDVTIPAFKRIFRHLKECESSNFLKVKLNGTQCGNRHTLESIFFTDQNGSDRVWAYRRLHRSFRWGIYDPVIESAWAAVDFVHGLCFQPFYASGDILYFHLYMTAMEALFPPVPVQIHWMNPVKLKSDHEFWNTIMDTNDIQNQVRNLDACAISAYMTNLSPYMDRLLRPFVKEVRLKNPEYIMFTPPGIGWLKSSDEYWRWYESVGGFKEISKKFGYCLDGTRENLEKVEKELKKKGSSC